MACPARAFFYYFTKLFVQIKSFNAVIPIKKKKKTKKKQYPGQKNYNKNCDGATKSSFRMFAVEQDLCGKI